MRNQLLPQGLPEISYSIREIVKKGFERQELGYPVIWENIGDPVQKGLLLPDWIKSIIARHLQDDSTFAYCDSKGLPETREFLASRTNAHDGFQITIDDITFFNGLGDAIARLYGTLPKDTRVLMPSPTYPSHSGAETNRIGSSPLTYNLDPKNNWYPDPAEIRSIVEKNRDISAILIINPDNPTGMVYPRKTMEAIVEIAREFDLFVIADEIYENLVYKGEMTRLSEVIGDVPGMAMKGISKEIPWPGSRCGWIEYYNRQTDPVFEGLCRRMDQCKMTEVCSTTLPQKVLPEILSDEKYQQFLKNRKRDLTRRMDLLKSTLEKPDEIHIAGGQGSFYATLHFDPEISSNLFDPELLNGEHQSMFHKWTAGKNLPPDLQLTYFLLAGVGVCTVPLSGFNCQVPGIRITLLEENPAQFEQMLNLLKEGLETVFSHRRSPIQA